MLIAYDNDTVTELNQQARNHLIASNRLNGPTLESAERTFQAGDRILCHQNQGRLGVLNGDLATVTNVDQDRKSLTVRLDRDSETRDLPHWYLHQGHVDYGYAMTGHKAQGVTTNRTFVIVTRTTDRRWAYVAVSRGRRANTLYLANPEPTNEPCTHLTHTDHDALDGLTAALNRNSTQAAAIDHAGPTLTDDDIDPLGPPPPSSDIAARVTWQIAKRQTQRDATQRQTPGLDFAAGH